MLCLGIEGSANKLGVGIIDENGKEYCNVRSSYYGDLGEGFQPKLASTHHRENIIPLLKKALSEANLTLDDIDLIAYTKGPGIGTLLKCGALTARTLALMYNKPIVKVNHCVAHIEMGRKCTNSSNPCILYASGANTQVICFSGNRYKIFGESVDVAVGNVIDRVARALYLPNNPAPGYQVEQKAKLGTKGMDICLSGTMTQALRIIDEKFTPVYNSIKNVSHADCDEHGCEVCEKKRFCEQFTNDMCFSLQETIYTMLVEITERAVAHVEADSVLLVGGVGCNLRLQEMMRIMCQERGARLCATDERYCIDNGLMIAWTGLLQYKSSGATPLSETIVTQRYRTDQVKVTWRDS